MTMKDWTELVSNLGFPIALCIIYIYDSRRSRAQLEERVRCLETEERKETLAVIAKNTDAMVTLNQTLRERPCLREAR